MLAGEDMTTCYLIETLLSRGLDVRIVFERRILALLHERLVWLLLIPRGDRLLCIESCLRVRLFLALDALRICFSKRTFLRANFILHCCRERARVIVLLIL